MCFSSLPVIAMGLFYCLNSVDIEIKMIQCVLQKTADHISHNKMPQKYYVVSFS